MAKPGAKNLITDVSGILVGNAQDSDVRTGVSVILAETPAIAAISVAGGGPGTRETDMLRSGMLVESVDAICLSGGSAFGLAAADGVLAGLKAEGRGYGFMDQPGVPKPPIVPAAILYDLANGGNKDWGDSAPYAGLGRAAFDAAGETFQLGKAGAAYGAKAGAQPGGLGSASIVTNDGVTIGALAAVNCFGSPYMPGSDAFWAWPYEEAGEFGAARPPVDFHMDAEDWGAAKLNPALGQNTTIACVATDAALNPSQAQRIAQMALSGFARAIRPVFAPFDGDAVFVLSTGAKPLGAAPELDVARFGEMAAGTLARAIARGVWEAKPNAPLT